jgi:hypothetical protein
LKALVREEKFDFWWDKDMSYPFWDEEIKRKINEADIIVCLISQNFINSEYITKVEGVITSKRLKNEGILVVPILFKPCSLVTCEWLKEINRFPRDGSYLYRKRYRSEIFLEIIEYIRKWYHGRVKPFKNKRAIYTLRRSSESSLSQEQLRILIKDSCDRARKMVPKESLRNKIIAWAKRILEEKKGQDIFLSKSELEEIDEKLLAGSSRKPDAQKVRWVLRCAQLHPQGRVKK